MNFPKFIVYTDGGARGNPGPAASAAIIKDSAGIVREKCGKYLGETTNNVAEYQGVILALQRLKETVSAGERFQTSVDFFLDSELVVKQLNGLFQVKNDSLRELVLKVRELETGFNKISYQHISRKKNVEADKLVNQILDKGENYG
ncbi:MAG: ribonuclease HI family protein [Patescibacteria group bacterium]|nr:ribonuclease HI family protein [Patescibacteria group bacterium]